MMFVLTQKVVGGLYLHNWLHGSKNIAVLTHDIHTISQANCSCIDDFYVPFTEAVAFSLEPPVKSPVDYSIIREQAIPAIAKHFPSRRAPPAA